MAEFIIMIAIIVICGLLFGKADTKRELLNQVGLVLSDRNYENKKEEEFRKYSIKAMKAVVDLNFGSLFRGIDGCVYIRLNLQIRFKK